MSEDCSQDDAINRTRRRRTSACHAAATLICLMAGGCAGLNLEDSSTPAPSPQPEGKRLAELAKSAFATAKLPGKPEVSPVHPAHDAQWGDWMFCIKSDSAPDALKYGVLVGHDAVLEVRSLVLIDGCERETYHPLEPAVQKVKSGGSPSHGH
jgi:hypothetical protein